MATFKPVELIEVYIWNKRVGAVAMDPNRGYYAFEYDAKFRKTGIELAPFQMPLSLATGPFIFTALPLETFKRLPAMLADALPDAFGNALVNAWMADKGVAADKITTLDRLAYMGKRGMGALEFRPARGSHVASSAALQLGKLVNVARQAVSGTVADDPHAKAVLAQIIQVGTSAGGARAKAAVAWNEATDELRPGQFDVEDGFQHWLLKFDGVGEDKALGVSKDYGRIEYAYSLMAKEAGVDMSRCHLLSENGRSHFMTQRFDRDGNKRIHMQSLCAISHMDYKQVGTHSYNQLFDAIQRLGLGQDTLRQAFRRMVFNVMAANRDDHPKNFAFLLSEGGTWKLAPAFDVTFSYRPDSAWVNQHLMSVNGKFSDITSQDIEAVAEQMGIRLEARTAIREVGKAVARWPEFAATAGVQEAEVEQIDAQIKLFCKPITDRENLA